MQQQLDYGTVRVPKRWTQRKSATVVGAVLLALMFLQWQLDLWALIATLARLL